MSRLRSPSFHARWFVVLTFWLAAWVPALAMGAQALNGDLAPWTQLCRSSLVSPRAGVAPYQASPRDDAGGDMGMFQHCAQCLAQHLGGDGLAPPPVAAVPALRADLSHAMPERFFSAPRTAHAWRAAPARAPPSNA